MIRCIFWQSLKKIKVGFRATLNVQNFKVALNPTLLYSFFYTKRDSYPRNIDPNVSNALFEWISRNINLLLTEREGCTGEYWPEVVVVRTEQSEVRTKMIEG